MEIEPASTPRATPVEVALRLVLDSVSRQPVETVPLADATGRVLGEDMVAGEDLCPFPRAAMDGIAVRSADVAGAGPDAPVTLRVVGTIYSGQVWPRALGPGEAVRIATGTPLPADADAVIPNELLQWRDDEVIVTGPAVSGRNVFPSGEDARAGETVLRAGTELTSGHLGLLAALGRSVVPVVRRPRVSILATGDELVPPEASLAPGQVRESNSYVLAAEVRAAGALPRLLGVARDHPEDLERKVREGLDADAFVICGGVSVGERDYVRQTLRRVGVTLRFAGVAMKPGAPVAFGTAGGCAVFALPGTPGAARIAFEVLVRPALRAMLGCPDLHRPAVRGWLAAPLRVRTGRKRHLWARAVLGERGVTVTPLPGQGTATLRSASDANALIEIGPEDADLAAGAPVTVRLLIPGALPVAPQPTPVAIGVVGATGAGKTALIERLIPEFRRLGISVAVVKHHVHFDAAETEGTDTARAARAGAVQTVLAGPGGAVVRRSDGAEVPLEALLSDITGAGCVLVEGYSRSALPKVLVVRAGVRSDRPAPAGPIIAVVADGAGPDLDIAGGVPRFGWDAVADLAAFLARTLGLASR
ncbi:MAG: molybdopterin-guanine dinucleotide biosynthesis protein B [Armatimonadota bacterium]|nr:molybdopterin-guanine dinucleotide biosynthesis protein B [Armatimonadota bacterium]